MKNTETTQTPAASDLSVSTGSFSSDEIQMIISGLSRLADAAGDYGDGYTRRAANALSDKIKKMNTEIGQSEEQPTK